MWANVDFIPERTLETFGDSLRRWRSVRHTSQLTLALNANTTTRHISFLENGRSRPSEAMIERLADALSLECNARDMLRLAAGFAPARSIRQTGISENDKAGQELASQLFKTTLSLQDAPNSASLVSRSYELRRNLGMDYCFFATIGRQETNYLIDFQNHGGMPDAWLDLYAKRDFRSIDPLLPAMFHGRGGISWTAAEGMRGAGRPLFAAAAAVGIRSGFIACSRDVDGTTNVLSMMGPGISMVPSQNEQALRTLAHSMLDGFDSSRNSHALSL